MGPRNEGHGHSGCPQPLYPPPLLLNSKDAVVGWGNSESLEQELWQPALGMCLA